ncbi:MAG: hypothetical protein EOP54_13110 [Sphingobacteriales bacterium]|nr:MAG: hypothetical protein EOP54_13110 [Sphingobacteriales bacterium]
MKKLSTLFAAIALIASGLLFSCGQGNINYNDDVVNLFDKYTTDFNTYTAVIDGEGGDIEQKKTALKGLEKVTDSCTTEMSKMKPTEEGKEFHQAVIDVYSGVKSQLIPAYNNLLNIENPDANVEAYNKAITEYNTAFDKIDGLVNKAITEQSKFASKVNMQIKK